MVLRAGERGGGPYGARMRMRRMTSSRARCRPIPEALDVSLGQGARLDPRFARALLHGVERRQECHAPDLHPAGWRSKDMGEVVVIVEVVYLHHDMEIIIAVRCIACHGRDSRRPAPPPSWEGGRRRGGSPGRGRRRGGHQAEPAQH